MLQGRWQHRGHADTCQNRACELHQRRRAKASQRTGRVGPLGARMTAIVRTGSAADVAGRSLFGAVFGPYTLVFAPTRAMKSPRAARCLIYSLPPGGGQAGFWAAKQPKIARSSRVFAACGAKMPGKTFFTALQGSEG